MLITKLSTNDKLLAFKKFLSHFRAHNRSKVPKINDKYSVNRIDDNYASCPAEIPTPRMAVIR